MPRKAPHTQFDFSGGELPPYRVGRTNDPTYHISVATTMNMMPKNDGPIICRPGTRRVSTAWNQDLSEKPRVLGISPDLQTGYSVEISGDTAAIHRLKAGVVVRPYIELAGFLDFTYDGIPLDGDYAFVRENSIGLTYSRSLGDVSLTFELQLNYATLYTGASKALVVYGVDNELLRTYYYDEAVSPYWYFLVAGSQVFIPYPITLTERDESVVVSGMSQTYLQSDLEDIRYTYSGDTIYITHKNYRPAVLYRVSEISWAYEEISLTKGPYDPIDPELQDIQLSVDDMTFQTELHVRGEDFSTGYSPGDYISYKVGSDYVLSTFVSVSSDTDKAIVEPVKSIVSGISANTRIEYQASGTFLYLTTAVTGPVLSATDAVFSPAIEGSWIRFRDIGSTGVGTTIKWALINNYVGVDVAGSGFLYHGGTSAAEVDVVQVDAPVTAFTEFDSITGLSSDGLNTTTLRSSSALFADEDTDRCVRLVFGDAVVHGVIQSDAGNTSQAVTISIDRSIPYNSDATRVNGGLVDSWRLGAFYEGNYPSVVALYNQRLAFGGTDTHPSTAHFSQIDDYYNFQPTTSDNISLATSAFHIKMTGTEKDRITWMHSGSKLVVGMEGAIWLLQGKDGLFSYNSYSASSDGAIGSKIPPVQIGNYLLVVHSSGRRIYETRYDDNVVSLAFDDGSSIPSHMFAGTGQTIRRVLVQYSPEPLLWVLRSDGLLICLRPKWNRDNITGYAMSRHVIGSYGDDVFEDLTDEVPEDITDETPETIELLTISGTTAAPYVEDIMVGYDNTLGMDVLYITTKRSNVRYLESLSFDYEAETSTDFDRMLYLDSARTLTSASPTTVWTGFEDYADQVVCIFADNTLVVEDTLFTGTLELDTAASEVTVGLNYDRHFTTLPPSVTQIAGNIGFQGRIARNTDILATLHRSFGITHGSALGESQMISEDFGTNEDVFNATDLFTGSLRLSSHQARSRTGSIKISQPRPYPLNVLSLTYQLEFE